MITSQVCLELSGMTLCDWECKTLAGSFPQKNVHGHGIGDATILMVKKQPVP